MCVGKCKSVMFKQLLLCYYDFSTHQIWKIFAGRCLSDFAHSSVTGMTCVHFLQVICRSYFRQFVCDRAYAEIVSQSLLGSTYAKAFGCVGIQHLKTDSTITFSFDFMLSGDVPMSFLLSLLSTHLIFASQALPWSCIMACLMIAKVGDKNCRKRSR